MFHDRSLYFLRVQKVPEPCSYILSLRKFARDRILSKPSMMVDILGFTHYTALLKTGQNTFQEVCMDVQGRYRRNVQLPQIGEAGQRRLLDSRVLVIGAGGLGSPVSMYLAAAGVGHLGIADADVVDISNLQRQILHGTPDLDTPKVFSARARLRNINPDVDVKVYHQWITPENIAEVMEPYDFVVEATDNIHVKFLVNDACVLVGQPFSHGGIREFTGQTLTVNPGQTACLRCLFPEAPAREEKRVELGVLGSVAGMLGTIQATEAIKYLTGAGEPLYNTLLGFDALVMHFRKTKISRDPHCPLCGESPKIRTFEQLAAAF